MSSYVGRCELDREKTSECEAGREQTNVIVLLGATVVSMDIYEMLIVFQQIECG